VCLVEFCGSYSLRPVSFNPLILVVTELTVILSICRTPGKFPLELRPRAELALGAVNGMAYLHEMSVVHFDLKPDNLLLEHGHLHRPSVFWDAQTEWEMPTLKVADFGLSKHKPKHYVSDVKDLRYGPHRLTYIWHDRWNVH
jgi:serine/threonine protein kinase